MKRASVMAVAVILVAAHARAQPNALGCAAEGDHERWALRTRSKPRSLARAKAVSLGTVLGWVIPAGHDASETGFARASERGLDRVFSAHRS